MSSVVTVICPKCGYSCGVSEDTIVNGRSRWNCDTCDVRLVTPELARRIRSQRAKATKKEDEA